MSFLVFTPFSFFDLTFFFVNFVQNFFRWSGEGMFSKGFFDWVWYLFF